MSIDLLTSNLASDVSRVIEMNLVSTSCAEKIKEHRQKQPAETWIAPNPWLSLTNDHKSSETASRSSRRHGELKWD